jgi:hypothetical protein
MALRVVAQENYTGCFIAAVATLLGKTYRETYAILHPGKNPSLESNHGFLDMSMQHAAFEALKRVGIKAHLSKVKRFETYTRHSENALLIIRWKFEPHLCHTIVYDGEARKFIDPSFGMAVQNKWTIKNLESQLDFGIIIDQIPKEEQHDSLGRISNGIQLPEWIKLVEVAPSQS